MPDTVHVSYPPIVWADPLEPVDCWAIKDTRSVLYIHESSL